MVSSKAFLLMAVPCVGLACCLVAGCGDRHEFFYLAFADADKDGAITRGWIPDYLPQSSRAIHSVQQDSPSREWCSFEFLSQDSQGLRKDLKSVNALPSSVRHVPSPGASWWPAVLKGNLDAEKIHRAGFDLYVVERPETSVTTGIFVFAIDWTKGRGFFYSTSKSGSVRSPSS
jgi:hypothetical protein